MITQKYRNEHPPSVAREFDHILAWLKAFLSISFNVDGTAQRPVLVGTIMATGRAAGSGDWLLCDGTAVSRTLYPDLFAAIGTAYGVGDGVNTFNVPDGRGRFLLGQATSGTGAVLGATGGTIDHTHTGPSHTHVLTTTAVATGVGTTVAVSPMATAGNGATSAANPPYVVVNYLILAR